MKLVEIILQNENSYYKCSSCKVYIVFMIIVFTVLTEITIYFAYYNWSLIKIMFLAVIECSSIEYINGRNKANKH